MHTVRSQSLQYGIYSRPDLGLGSGFGPDLPVFVSSHADRSAFFCFLLCRWGSFLVTLFVSSRIGRVFLKCRRDMDCHTAPGFPWQEIKSPGRILARGTSCQCSVGTSAKLRQRKSLKSNIYSYQVRYRSSYSPGTVPYRYESSKCTIRQLGQYRIHA